MAANELWLARDRMGFTLYPRKPDWLGAGDFWNIMKGERDVSGFSERFPPLDVGQCVPIRVEPVGLAEGHSEGGGS